MLHNLYDEPNSLKNIDIVAYIIDIMQLILNNYRLILTSSKFTLNF